MSDLNETEIQALHEALDDEYRAWTTYVQVIRDFGAVRPFINILNAEARHIEALCALFTRYRIPIPENPWPGKVSHFGSVREACAAGVAAEIENSQIYQRLLTSTHRHDILTVFTNLQEASRRRHLPAFLRCTQRRG